MQNLFVVHYSEIALKGNNRADFVKALRRNINRSLHGIEHDTTHFEGRIFVHSSGLSSPSSDSVQRTLMSMV